VTTVFTPILRRAVDHVPGAVGAIFAAWDGEAVDHVTSASTYDMLLLAAHFGIVLNLLQSALHLFHFGEAEEVILQHTGMDLVVRSVGEGYYVVLASRAGTHLATARREVAELATALRAEM
jgi:predicted regulator of Ras-like GTPase activity (Roadblock/LC7/MglB family)